VGDVFEGPFRADIGEGGGRFFFERGGAHPHVLAQGGVAQVVFRPAR
jgi:hypothetical protein